jgi:hypothetical protein
VPEASTAMATVAAAAIATPFSRAWRSTSSPSMPMTTVVPAVSTARPAVCIAVTTASCAAAPSGSSARNRVTMNSLSGMPPAASAQAARIKVSRFAPIASTGAAGSASHS